MQVDGGTLEARTVLHFIDGDRKCSITYKGQMFFEDSEELPVAGLDLPIRPGLYAVMKSDPHKETKLGVNGDSIAGILFIHYDVFRDEVEPEEDDE
jgi:hypothetical protein